MKATFNIKTKVFTVTGKEIMPFKTTIQSDHDDYWDSVQSKKTGEPLYDINLYCDDFVGADKFDDKNPKNYQAQFVNLILGGEFTEVGNDYRNLPLKVTTGEFNPLIATYFIYTKNGKVLFKTKSLNKASDFTVINKVKYPNMTMIAIDEFGFKKVLIDKFGKNPKK